MKIPLDSFVVLVYHIKMNKLNRTIIRNKILEYAPRMQPLLPSHTAHPGGRIAIAHMYDVLKSVFGMPIDQVRDCRLDDALAILDYCMENATVKGVASPLRKMYDAEPEEQLETRVTVDMFFE